MVSSPVRVEVAVRNLMWIVLAGCVVPPLKLSSGVDSADDTDQGYVPNRPSGGNGGNGGPGDTFDPGDLGGGGVVVPPGGGGGNGGGSGGAVDTTDTFDTGAGPGGYFTPAGLFFRGLFAVDDSGDVAPFRATSGGATYLLDAELDLYFYDAANNFCVLGYLVESGPGTSTHPGGGDADLQAWLAANGQLAGFAVRTSEYVPFGPYDPQTGLDCTFDPALWTADIHTAMFSGTRAFYVGAGSALGTGDAQKMAASLAGSGGFPALDVWFGGFFESSFTWTNTSGAPAGTSDAGVFAEVLGANMTQQTPAVWLDPSNIPAKGPIPRSVVWVYPSVGLTFNYTP